MFVVTGPSGAGKGTLVQALLAACRELRARRLGDDAQPAAGRDRRSSITGFSRDEEFDRRLERGDFLEYVTSFPWGQRYGTLRSELDRIAAAGRIPLLELETEGALG